MRRSVAEQLLAVLRRLFNTSGSRRSGSQPRSARPASNQRQQSRQRTGQQSRKTPPSPGSPSMPSTRSTSPSSPPSTPPSSGRATPSRPTRESNRANRRGRDSTAHPPALPDTSFDNVQVVYSPTLDGDPDPGEVVWTWVPYEDDPTQGKDRPVVIIGRQGDLLAGIQLTSKGHDRGDDYMPVGTGSWDPQGRPSWAKLDRVLSVDPSAVRREGAVLDKQRFDQLITAIRRAQ